MERKQPVIRSSAEESLMSLFDDDGDVSLPYAGTSGWSGTDTSEERAVFADTHGVTKRVQEYIMNLLITRGEEGATWREISNLTLWHHGTTSGALSVLHKEGRIDRLTERRNRCRVYVHPRYINGRNTDSQGRKPKACPNCGHVDD